MPNPLDVPEWIGTNTTKIMKDSLGFSQQVAQRVGELITNVGEIVSLVTPGGAAVKGLKTVRKVASKLPAKTRFAKNLSLSASSSKMTKASTNGTSVSKVPNRITEKVKIDLPVNKQKPEQLNLFVSTSSSKQKPEQLHLFASTSNSKQKPEQLNLFNPINSNNISRTKPPISEQKIITVKVPEEKLLLKDVRRKINLIKRNNNDPELNIKSEYNRDPKVTANYKKRLIKKLEEWGAQEETIHNVKTNKDMDHATDLYIGGKDTPSNIQSLDKGFNRSFGAQVENQSRNCPIGTKLNIKFVVNWKRNIITQMIIYFINYYNYN